MKSDGFNESSAANVLDLSLKPGYSHLPGGPFWRWRSCFAAGDPVAARLAREARKAQNSGQVVHAYLLYAEAAARDPKVGSYRDNRDALAPLAKLLTAANVEAAPDIKADIQAAESPNSDEADPAIHSASALDLEEAHQLQGLPHLKLTGTVRELDLRGDVKTLYREVAAAWGAAFVMLLDKDLDAFGSSIHFWHVERRFPRRDGGTDILATHTFLFPVTQDNTIFVAHDSEPKRAEYEPMVVSTRYPLPEATGAKELTDAATAVRSTLGNMRGLAFDPITRTA